MPPPLRRCADAAAAAAPAPLPQQKFRHISCSKIMIFGREIFVCEMCCFVMTNEKRQEQETHNYFYYVGNSLLLLKIIKFSCSLFCHCSARAKLSKKRHLTTLHTGQTACRTIYLCALLSQYIPGRSTCVTTQKWISLIEDKLIALGNYGV